MTTEDKKQEYQERYRFWSDKRVAQLSFQDNLLLTLSLACFAYFWTERNSVYSDLLIDSTASIDWNIVIYFMGMFFIIISLFAGLTLSLTRLYDLRLTSHILLTRKRALKREDKLKDNELKSNGLLTTFKSLVILFFNYQKYEITKNDLKGDYSNLLNKFTKARQFSRDLGTSTWSLLKCQAISFFLSIILFAFVSIDK